MKYDLCAPIIQWLLQETWERGGLVNIDAKGQFYLWKDKNNRVIQQRA